MDHATEKSETATFGGGCFWCMQHLFDQVNGVVKTTVGYIGGSAETATYSIVSSGNTAHREAIQIQYYPEKVSYLTLVELFLHNIDPTNDRGQFADIGPQYRSAIYYHTEMQREIATALFQEILLTGQLPVIYTEILPAQRFYPAEEYHQQYAEKNETHYSRYYQACGRPQKLKELWKNPR